MANINMCGQNACEKGGQAASAAAPSGARQFVAFVPRSVLWSQRPKPHKKYMYVYLLPANRPLDKTNIWEATAEESTLSGWSAKDSRKKTTYFQQEIRYSDFTENFSITACFRYVFQSYTIGS